MMDSTMPVLTMEDDLGIVYHIENAQQFWSELEDILTLPKEPPTLELLDATLKRSVSLCAAYHEQYLQSPLQLEHACKQILESELFTFHSGRMCQLLGDDLQSNTDPHIQLIDYSVLLYFGRRRVDFFRSHKVWKPLVPLLMDHILVEIDSDLEDVYFETGNASGHNFVTPIEASLRDLSVQLLYEVCRVQKFSLPDLKIFNEFFLDHLFDLVEQTRYMRDETFNYSVIKLIVSLNEQYMVATLHSPDKSTGPAESSNMILRVLMRRLGSSNTFGENLIFMLNRADHSPEDLCMQLLVLKLLYLLFTTAGTSEYFYTNDLRVLVDVFLREINDLDDDSESLRHTYLRVLHPLLTKTQLRDVPYKRPQIVFALESLLSNAKIREVHTTTKRLVERCLGGDWCVQLRTSDKKSLVDSDSVDSRLDALSSDGVERSTTMSRVGISSVSASAHLDKPRTLKASKSMEFTSQPPPGKTVPADDTPTSATFVSSAASNPTFSNAPKRKGTADSVHIEGVYAPRIHVSQRSEPEHRHHAHRDIKTSSTNSLPVLGAKESISPLILNSPSSSQQTHTRRTAPPPPNKRRKPPAIPTAKNGDVTFTPIKSSSPLSRG